MTASRGDSLDEQAKANGKGPDGFDAKNVPRYGTPGEMRAWMAAATGAQSIGAGVRFGGDQGTCAQLTLENVDGHPRTVFFEAEKDISNHKALAPQLTGQGGVPATYITNASVAQAFYFLFTRIAKLVDPLDPLERFRERLNGYRRDANRTEGWDFETGESKYQFLCALRDWPYSKQELGLWRARRERINPDDPQPPKPRPPLFVVSNEDGTEDEWTSAGHLGTYLRHHDGENSITVDAKSMGSFVGVLGGQRRPMQAWGQTHSNRADKADLILIRLPRLCEDPDYPGETPPANTGRADLA